MQAMQAVKVGPIYLSMGVFWGQNFEREYINVLLDKLLLCVIIQI